jgi:tyrosyl-tRNA synthetase
MCSNLGLMASSQTCIRLWWQRKEFHMQGNQMKTRAFTNHKFRRLQSTAETHDIDCSGKILNILRERGLIDACTNDGLLSEASRKPLRVYCGFDPTADSLHLGNLLGIVVLSWFQRFGHTPVILIGGATGSIGDPSGKSVERPLLEIETIQSNTAKIVQNLEEILSRNSKHSPPLVMNNLDWFEDMSFLDFLREVGRYARVGTMIARDSVKSRLDSEAGMSFTEFSYQLLQGYDFMHLFRNHGVTVQIGGSDQWGNIVAGSDLVRRIIAQESVFGLTFPLLLKSDGKKFGKSEEGAIWLSPERLSAFKFYQYLLQTKDEDVLRLMMMLTFIPLDEIKIYEKLMDSTDYVPNTAQIRLAEEVTKFVHGEVGLQQAVAATNGLLPGTDTELDIDVLQSLVNVVPTAIFKRNEIIGVPLVDIIVKVGLRQSKGEVRRLINGGGVRLNNDKVLDDSTCINPINLIAGKMLLISTGKKNKFLLQVESS